MLSFIIGLVGSLILALGAAYPDKSVLKSYYSIKNWLLGIGGLLMFLYSVINYLNGSLVFFVFLEGFVVVASILMFIDLRDEIDEFIIGIAGLFFVIWSLYLFDGYQTLIFILGLIGVALGYALDTGTRKRNIALFVGSVLISLYSYIDFDFFFFWLNVFFAIFSLWNVYLLKQTD